MRTQSTHIPKHFVVHTEGVEDLMAILKREDAVRQFSFTPGTISSEVFPEGANPYNLKLEDKEDDKGQRD